MNLFTVLYIEMGTIHDLFTNVLLFLLRKRFSLMKLSVTDDLQIQPYNKNSTIRIVEFRSEI